MHDCPFFTIKESNGICDLPPMINFGNLEFIFRSGDLELAFTDEELVYYSL